MTKSKSTADRLDLLTQVDQSVAEGLLQLIINQDSLILKWTNFLVVLQGSAIAAIWLILSTDLKYVPKNIPYHELFVLFVSTLAGTASYFIKTAIIREFDNQGFFLSRYCRLENFTGKIWNESLADRIELSISQGKVGQGFIAKRMKMLTFSIISMWLLISSYSFYILFYE